MPETPRIESSARLPLLERTCQGVVLLIGAVCVYTGSKGPFGIDGLAYMDVARAYLHHDWHTAINGYWGPLYSWLLAIGLWVFRPGMRGELVLVHALNYALFVKALLTFGSFWRAIAAWSRKADSDETSLPDAAPVAWILFGYLMFLVTFVWSLDDVTPDILVACIVFAICTRLFMIETDGGRGMASYLLLGILLAIGYYAKAILLFFAVFVLAGLMLRAFRSRSFREPLVAAVVFWVLIAPFVAALSRTVGHFTAGDSGRLNYAWFVDGTETKTWMTTDAAPLPFYPGPAVFGSPRVFLVPYLEGVTYAPWYDAARFDKRSQPRLSLRGQLRQLAVNLKLIKEQVLGTEAVLLVPLLILWWQRPNPSWRRLVATCFCTLPIVGVVGLYLLTHLVMRFVLGFFLVLWGAAFASISSSSSSFSDSNSLVLTRRVLLAGILVFAVIELPGVLHFALSHSAENSDRDIAIAQALPVYGVVPGNAVASLGDGQEDYWAHWAAVPVVAEIWKRDLREFWAESPELQGLALRAMANSGAKAAVWRRDSDRPCPALWISLPENSGCLILLPDAEQNSRTTIDTPSRQRYP